MMKRNKTKFSKILAVIFMFLIFLSSCENKKPDTESTPAVTETEDIKHGIVFYEEGRFGGWPANHGIWSWDNEILVGFVNASHKDTKGFHTYDSDSGNNNYARSKDGGETWTIEDAYEHGQTAWGHDNNISSENADTPIPLTEAVSDFTNPDFIFTFLRHNNHYGPSHFYYSNDRGKKWEGPFIFPDLNTHGIASRTDYIVDGEKDLKAFVTVAKSNKREGRVAMVQTTDGGLNWELVSWLGDDEPEGFDIMSSSIRISGNELLSVIRTRTENRVDLLTAHYSTDNGKTWEKIKDPVSDTGRGGSPPALLKLKDGRLALAYIYRSQYGSRVNIRFSKDDGKSWSDEIVLRHGEGSNWDAGYPRMVQRADGKLVLIYYWNNANQEGSKPYRYIASTIFSPDLWE